MADSDLFDDDEYRMMGTAFVDAEPLPPGLDWDYFGPRPGFDDRFSDDGGELGDTENPAIEAVFDWGNPLIGQSLSSRVRRPNFGDGALQRACIPQPCVPIAEWPRRPMLLPRVGRQPTPPPRPCPPRPCPTLRVPAGSWSNMATASFGVGADDPDWEICERVPVY